MNEFLNLPVYSTVKFSQAWLYYHDIAQNMISENSMDVARFGDRWEQLNELFHAAQDISPDALNDWCVNACKGDQELEQFLRELLSIETHADEAVRSSILQLAQEVTLAESLLGTRIGAYRIDSLLGKGGMGEVYLASRADGEFNKEVAIKVVQKRTRQQDFLRFFDTERRVMADLNHRYIPALLDAGQLEDGRPYFICDYILGKRIDEYCAQDNVSPAACLALFERVVEALSYAHNNLVLHLDIKPENILVRGNGEPSLLDFGLSRLMTAMEEGVPAFSPQYASPEQLAGRAVSAASDVYSLGVLLHQLLTGLSPFRVDASKLSLNSIVGERRKMKTSWAESGALKAFDQDLRAIIMKATHDDPSERYSSAEAMLQDLRRHNQHKPISARQPTILYRAGKYLRRNSLEVGLAAGTLVLFTILSVRESSLMEQMEQSLQSSRGEVQQQQQRSEQMQSALGWLGQQALVHDGDVELTITNVKKEFAEQPYAAAEVLLNMGIMTMENGQTELAIRLLDVAAINFSAAEQTIQQDHANVALAMLRAQLDVGDLNAVQRVLIDALQHEMLFLDGRWLALVDESITAFLATGDTENVAKFIGDGIAAVQGRTGSYHPAYAAGLMMRARLQQAQNQRAAAEQDYREALNVLQKSRSITGAENSALVGGLMELTLQHYLVLMREDNRLDEAQALERQILKLIN